MINYKAYLDFKEKYGSDVSLIHIVILLMYLSDTEIDATIEFVNDIYKLTIGERDHLLELESMGIIKITGLHRISLRPLGEELLGFNEVDRITQTSEIIRDLFPKGVKSGGFPVRSSLVDIETKLKKFFKKHKYTHEQVMEATRRYVNRKKQENYAYMQIAAYFIEKNGISALASEIDNLNDEEETESFTDNAERL